MKEIESSDFLRITIETYKGKSFASYKELAEKAGVNQGNLSEFLNGKRASLNFDSAWKILDFLGLLDSLKGVDRLASEGSSPNQMPIPVYAIAGAGPGVLPDQLEPLFTVFAPPEYFRRSDYAVVVSGHSMEPLIPHGSIVGIRTGDPFQANELFLAEIPYEGLVVKRVGVDLKAEEFVFKSQNPDKEAYPDFRLSVHEAEKIIIGRVVWVMVAY